MEASWATGRTGSSQGTREATEEVELKSDLVGEQNVGDTCGFSFLQG